LYYARLTVKKAHADMGRESVEERGLAVTKQSKQKRTSRMIRQLRKLGYRIEAPNPQPSQAQAE